MNQINVLVRTFSVYFQRNNPTVTNTINKGLDYIARSINEDEPVYTLALCSYTLHLAKHTSKQSAFNLLESKAKTRGNLKWWAKETPKEESKNPWNKLPRSIDIETTSYALLTFIEANLLEDAAPVFEWLANQQNSLGGFTSSHDTVVGLQSLYKLVTKIATPTSMQIEYKYAESGAGKFTINRNNIMIQQTMQVNNICLVAYNKIYQFIVLFDV